MPLLFYFAKKSRTASLKAKNPGIRNLLWRFMNMKKHVKKCSLDSGSGNVFGFQKLGKTGKGFVPVPAGKNPSGKGSGHVQISTQAFFRFLKKAIAVQTVKIVFQKKSV